MVLIMNQKKVFLLLISLVLMVSLFANVVSAQEEDGFLPDIIEKWLKVFFIDLGDWTKSAPETFVIYSKFLFFWLVFAVLFWGAEKVFKDRKNIAGIVAFILAIISVALTPSSVMLFLFETYRTVISFFFALLPFIIGLILSHRIGGEETWKRILKAIIYIAMAVVTFALSGTLYAVEDSLYTEFADWAALGATIALIVGIAKLIGSIGGERPHMFREGGLGDRGWNWARDRLGRRSEEPPEAEGAARAEVRADRREVRQAKRALRELKKFRRNLCRSGVSRETAQNMTRTEISKLRRRITTLEALERREIRAEHKEEAYLRRAGFSTTRLNRIRNLMQTELNAINRLNSLVNDLETSVTEGRFNLPQAKRDIRGIEDLFELLIKIDAEEIQEERH